MGEQLWVVGFHEVGLKLLEEFEFNNLFPKARRGMWRLFAQMVMMRWRRPEYQSAVRGGTITLAFWR